MVHSPQCYTPAHRGKTLVLALAPAPAPAPVPAPVLGPEVDTVTEDPGISPQPL